MKGNLQYRPCKKSFTKEPTKFLTSWIQTSKARQQKFKKISGVGSSLPYGGGGGGKGAHDPFFKTFYIAVRIAILTVYKQVF